MSKYLFATATGATLLVFSAVSASAAIACSGNVCWHVKEKYTYPAESKVIIHEDSWKPASGVTIREHEGRGYWKGDVWTDF